MNPAYYSDEDIYESEDIYEREDLESSPSPHSPQRPQQHAHAHEDHNSMNSETPRKAPPSNQLGTTSFETTHLLPRKLTMQYDRATAPPQDVYTHFNTTPPTAAPNGDDSHAYRAATRLPSTNLFLPTDVAYAREIHDEWVALQDHGLNPHEHLTQTLALLFRSDRRRQQQPDLTTTTTTGPVTAERMVKFRVTPQTHDDDCASRYWNGPPALLSTTPSSSTTGGHTYDEFRGLLGGDDGSAPACTYWLSLDSLGFPRSSVLTHPSSPQEKLKRAAYVVDGRLLCAYLSVAAAAAAGAGHEDSWNGETPRIEVSEDGNWKMTTIEEVSEEDEEEEQEEEEEKRRGARHEVLCSAAMALWDRVVGDRWDVWAVQGHVTEEGEWDGCSMTRVDDGWLGGPHSVRLLLRWINEIHLWGLTVHAQAVREDSAVCAGVAEELVQGRKRRSSSGSGGRSFLRDALDSARKA
ncbi:hypothetical protein SLS58_009525 [Diplodia intermedia]|uniref:Uncharacterized protein n=1 Tax=Diplodia intermedia TaxID=856260 RepID=A0ABR3TC40_9PEZI